MLLKIDLINDAYSKMRISGVTKQPESEDLVLALNRLENMVREFRARNVCVDWNVVDQPDLNDYHNLAPEHYDSMSTMLASRLLVDFGKAASPEFTMMVSAAMSFLYSSTAVKQQTVYPPRQPLGRGNRRYRGWYSNTMPHIQRPPQDCTETTVMYVDDIQDFTEHYDAYLKDAEDIQSYTIEADNGLTIVSDSNTVTDVNYQIRADGTNTTTTTDEWLRVKIVITTTDGRVETRVKNFTLKEVQI